MAKWTGLGDNTKLFWTGLSQVDFNFNPKAHIFFHFICKKEAM
jgi:hypothetical protein